MIKQAPTTGRLLAMALFALSCFGLLLYLWTAFGGPRPFAPEGWRMHVRFDEAIRLVEQADVRISGVSVGTVRKVSLDPGSGLTDAEIEIDPAFAPRPADTRAVLRQRSLLGETYVELTPGTRGARKLSDGDVLAQGAVAETVELDELFRTFDPRTRRAFSAWLTAQGEVLTGRGRELNGALAQLEPFTAEGGDVLAVLRDQQEATRAFVRDGGTALGALTERQGQLRGLVTASADVFRATASSDAQLADAVRAFPRFLHETRATVTRAARFADATQPLVEQLQPTAAPFDDLVRDGRPVVEDLGALLAAAPGLERAARTGLPAVETVLDVSEPLLTRVTPFLGEVVPIVDHAADYRRELTAFFANVAAATQATMPAAAGGPPLHLLRAVAPLSPEGLAAYPTRLATSRAAPYLAPGGYAELATGLPSFDAARCTSTPAPTLGDSVPADVRDLIARFFLTPGLAGPACRDQAPLGPLLTGSGGRYPRLAALPPTVVPSSTEEDPP